MPAAGRGLRMGGERKQFRTLGRSPILHQTLRLFDTHPHVDGIVVAVPAKDIASLRGELRSLGLSKLLDVVAGGASRQASVERALAALPPAVDVVLVHDAVRPFLPAERIGAVIDAAVEFGAAALAVPVSDTLRDGTDGFFGVTVPRAGLYQMQTPQGCRRDRFEEAHKKARREGYEETDDVALIRRAGYAVRVVEGTSTNIKITTPADWTLARAIWESSRLDETASPLDDAAPESDESPGGAQVEEGRGAGKKADDDGKSRRRLS